MKLSQLVAHKQQTDPRYKSATTDEVVEQLYAQQSRILSDTREKLRRAEQTKKDPISIEISPSGDLQISKSAYDTQLQSTSTTRKTLVRSDTVSGLAKVLDPLMRATKAMYAGGGALKAHPLHEVDESGRTTKKPLKNDQGKQLYAVDPLSQFKAVCYLLDNNTEAREALQTINRILQDVTLEDLKSFQLTKPDLDSPKPVKPVPRNGFNRSASMQALLDSIKPDDTQKDDGGPKLPGE